MTETHPGVDGPASIAEVRQAIDRVDGDIVRSLGERTRLVHQAARFKRTDAEAAAPERARAVVARVRSLAAAEGVDPDLVADIYELMIARFIDAERADIRNRQPANDR